MKGARGILNVPRRMSWRTAFTYTLVAVLAGSLFTAIPYYADSSASWAIEDRRLYGFVFTYALTLAGATPTLLVFAALLWWLIRPVRRQRAAWWLLVGGFLGLAVPWALSTAGFLLDRLYFPADLQRLKAALIFPLMGSMMYASQPASVQMSVGVATATALWLALRWSPPPSG